MSVQPFTCVSIAIASCADLVTLKLAVICGRCTQDEQRDRLPW
jgi:hypothetical protein